MNDKLIGRTNLSENLIIPVTRYNSFFSRNSGISFCKTKLKPDRDIPDRTIARLIEVFTIPKSEGTINFQRITQNRNPREVRETQSRKR